MYVCGELYCFFFFQAEDGIRDVAVTGVQTCALPIFGSLVVVDENSRPIGLVTERDLVRKVCIQDAYTSKIITKEIMSSPLITIESKSSPSEAIDTMLQNNVRHLLVVDNNRSPKDKNKPIGII